MTGVRFPFEHPAPGALRVPCPMCGEPATHKVAEETEDRQRHEFTNYLCCEHFGAVMGPTAVRWCGGNWP